MSNEQYENRGIFRRIFFLYAGILLLAALAVEFSITNAVREDYVDRLKSNLIAQAKLIADEVPFESLSPLDALCKRLKDKTGARITIIAPAGKVLGDSDFESSGMDNHSHRQEIQQAILDHAGSAIRFSDTLKYDLLYVAIPVVNSNKPAGFIRMSVPLRDIDGAVNALRIRIIAVVIIVLFATALFSFWQLDRIRRFTRRIRDFSGDLARGELGKKLFLENAGEFDQIADSLNAMSTELQRTIASNNEEKNRLNVILRSIPDALFIFDEKGIILMASAASTNLFGNVAFSGRPFIEVIRNNEFFSLVEQVRKTAEAGTTEFKIDFPEERYCVVRVSPFMYGEEKVLSGFVAIFHDITQLHKLEQTRKDFVVNISHELKTPITAIAGFAETLLEGALDDKQHAVKFLETIKANSRRINSLVDDLMTISKIELGVIKIDKRKVRFIDAAESVVALLRNKAADKNLTLTFSAAPGCEVVLADRDRITQILTNLVDNGIKFTEQGSVTFGTEEKNGKPVIFVADTGIGVTQKHLPRLGERFYRVDAGRSRNMGGTGLGLAIVKHLVKAHGWEMQIESTAGKGTKVRIFTA
jgi:two-component system, OmpR family, phosphate regulon sensor histidine kinase PhoR